MDRRKSGALAELARAIEHDPARSIPIDANGGGTRHQHQGILEDAIVALVGSVNGPLVEPPGYESAALAVVDAVYASRARYASVERVVARVRDQLAATHTGTISVRALVDELRSIAAVPTTRAAADEALVAWFGNRAFTPGTPVPKARTVLEVGDRLLAAGLSDRSDFTDPGLVIEVLLPIPGVGIATLRYLLLLLGHQYSKPDVHILGWFRKVLGPSAASTYTPAEAARLVDRAILRAQPRTGGASVRAAEHLIWEVASGRRPGSFPVAPQAVPGESAA